MPLLPATLLSLDATGPNTYSPRYLRSRDEVWVRRGMEEYEDRVGLCVSALDDAWSEHVEPALTSAGARRAAVRGIKHLLDRDHRSEVRALIAPRALRKAIFELAASGVGRERTISEVAAKMNFDAAAVEACIYADREGARTVGAARRMRSPAELVQDYNLALVQGLLLRSTRVDVEIPEHVRPVVRFAKLRGLLVEIAESEGAVRLGISGPLSLFRKTMKYGHALATFFPTVVSVPRFTVDVQCTLRDAPVSFRVVHGDPLPRTHALPRENDSAVERALVRDMRRLGGDWTLVREAALVRAGKHSFFPDFTLERGEARVLVEIVGFYTADYLARKVRTLACAETALPVLVCIDESLDCGELSSLEHRVLRFKKRIDARALVAAAQACIASLGRPSRPR